jgi:hypothetical protein
LFLNYHNLGTKFAKISADFDRKLRQVCKTSILVAKRSVPWRLCFTSGKSEKGDKE